MQVFQDLLHLQRREQETKSLHKPHALARLGQRGDTTGQVTAQPEALTIHISATTAARGPASKARKDPAVLQLLCLGHSAHVTAGEGAGPYQHSRTQGTALPPAHGLFSATRQRQTNWCPEISMPALLTPPRYTILCTVLSQPCGVTTPSWSQAQAWALSPFLSPSFFLLKTCLPSQLPWA